MAIGSSVGNTETEITAQAVSPHPSGQGLFPNPCLPHRQKINPKEIPASAFMVIPKTSILYPPSPKSQTLQSFSGVVLQEDSARTTLQMEHGVSSPTELDKNADIDTAIISRNERIEAFYHDKHENALKIALAITGSPENAENAVSKTYLELLEGKTSIEYFFNALVGNAINDTNRANWKTENIESLDAPPYVPRRDYSETGEEEENSFLAVQFVSQLRDDRDPLDILIEQKDLEDAEAEVRRNWKFRWVTQKKWAERFGLYKESTRNVTKQGGSREL